jgi:hypothetical protein
MIFLLVRGLPWLIGISAFLACQWQWRHPSVYPYPLLASLVAFCAASGLIAYRRLSLDELLSKMAPAVIALSSMGFAFLLVEAPESRLALSILFAGASIVSLEMLWLLVFDPARYPVHGLSRLNVAYMPLSIFFTNLGLAGLGYFLRTPEWIAPAVLATLGAASFWLTSPNAHGKGQRLRWTILGAAVGLQAGILTIILPVSIVVQGCLAAMLIAIPLRIRRYGSDPVPRRAVAVSEGVSVGVIFITVLLMSRWA